MAMPVSGEWIEDEFSGIARLGIGKTDIIVAGGDCGFEQKDAIEHISKQRGVAVLDTTFRPVISALCEIEMARPAIIIHSTQAVIGVLFGVFVAYVAFRNSIEGRLDLKPGRILLSSIMVMYSVVQIAKPYKFHVIFVDSLTICQLTGSVS